VLQRTAGNRVVSRSVRDGAIRAQRRVPAPPVRNPFKDPAARWDAKAAGEALDAYLRLDPAARRACVKASYKKELQPVLSAAYRLWLGLALKEDQVRRYGDAFREIGRIVQEEETRAAARMSDDQIATVQSRFLKDEVRPLTAHSRAPPKKRRSDWDRLPPTERGTWLSRGNEAIEKIVAYATARFPHLGIRPTHFRLGFADCGREILAFTEEDGPHGVRVVVGYEFVGVARSKPAYMMDVVVHELYGHPGYAKDNAEYELALYDAAMAKLPEYVKPPRDSQARAWEIYDYAYPASEIYAELRATPYGTLPPPDEGFLAGIPLVPNTDPKLIVATMLGLIRRRWAPTLFIPLIRGLRMRMVIDPSITGDALKLFDEAVRDNFGAVTLKKVSK
jgi:hypothetical protein